MSFAPSLLRRINIGLPPVIGSIATWFRCFFGSNARMLISADCSGIFQIDFGLEEVQPKQLFLLPSDHLHKTERILMISPFERRPHYYLISTSLSLVLLDDRCPNRPILQWTHTSPSPPVYLSSTFLEADLSVIGVCGQQSAALFYAVRFSHEGRPPISAGTPFRAAKTSDFIYTLSSPDVSFPYKALNDRIAAPLAGVCFVPSQDAFVLLQATGFGDVYQQAFSSAPVEAERNLQEISAWCLQWYRDLERSMARSCDVPSRMVNIDIKSIMKPTPLPHVFCPICMAKNWAKKRPTIAKVREYLAGLFCYACGQALIKSELLLTSWHEDRIPENVSAVSFTLSRLAEVDAEKADDPQSRLMLNLWRGDDISQELRERDILVKERYNQMIAEASLDSDESSVEGHDLQLGECPHNKAGSSANEPRHKRKRAK